MHWVEGVGGEVLAFEKQDDSGQRPQDEHLPHVRLRDPQQIAEEHVGKIDVRGIFRHEHEAYGEERREDDAHARVRFEVGRLPHREDEADDEERGRERADVTFVTTEEYFAGRDAAPRPLSSVLDLSKIEATGFTPADSSRRIEEYVASLRG